MKMDRDSSTLDFRSMASYFRYPIFALHFLITVQGTIFTIKNNCPFTVWGAAIPGGGKQLKQGGTWQISVTGSNRGRIWARTNCLFDASGKGKCQTGDCDGVLQCEKYGTPPNTMAEYSIGPNADYQDFFDISVVDGFNVPMEFSSSSRGCNRMSKCMGDVTGYCPNELRVPGGCSGPCTVFKTDEYCCFSGANCTPTNYSKYFKERCPDAYSYPMDDDQRSSFTCPTGSDYDVTFCPCVFRQQ